MTGADAECQTLAAGVGLPGNYLAWLSDGTDSPATRFRRSGQPYVLVNGEAIASSWTDLTTEKPGGSFLTVPLNRTEANGEITDQTPVARAWSATETNGELVDPGTTTCAGWESTEDNLFGHVGDPTRDDVDWTNAAFAACDDDEARLYCFQQE